MADEDQRDLRKRNSELEYEVQRLRGRIESFRIVAVASLLLLLLVVVWVRTLYTDANLKAYVAAYEIADRCTRECDCSRIGLDR